MNGVARYYNDAEFRYRCEATRAVLGREGAYFDAGAILAILDAHDRATQPPPAEDDYIERIGTLLGAQARQQWTAEPVAIAA